MAKVRVSVSSSCPGMDSHEESLERAVEATWDKLATGCEGEVSVALLPRQAVRGLNQAYRGVKRPTDVLAFSVTDEVGRGHGLLGEIVICPEVAARQARQRGHSLAEELVLLAVHGALHLLGCEDASEEGRQAMKAQEKSILRLLGQNEKTAD